MTFFINNFFKYIFYFFFNIFKNRQFIILMPGLLGILFKKIIIFDKYNKKFLSIKIRNKYDTLTLYEIFGQDFYNINRLSVSNKINLKLLEIKNNNLIPLIIDCGANIGCSSIYFNKMIKNSKIINIEPEEKNFSILEHNCNSNMYKNINSAISSKIISFEIKDKNDDRAFMVKEKTNGDKKSVTINQILANQGNKFKPFLIKFDIEGFEKDVFAENLDWVNEFKIIIIEIHDWMLPGENCSKNFFNAISRLNKDVIIKGENLIVINNDYT